MYKSTFTKGKKKKILINESSDSCIYNLACHIYSTVKEFIS